VSVNAAASRPIQTMGTPFSGVSGTGVALDIGVFLNEERKQMSNACSKGALFGLGCGDNFDLSRDGANLWLSGIQNEAKKDVYFYTTMWKKTLNPLRYCNLASNLVLSWPNDGMAEVENCFLAGGKKMWGKTAKRKFTLNSGNPVENPFEGECHTGERKRVFAVVCLFV
jgi:hypothetical protein